MEPSLAVSHPHWQSREAQLQNLQASGRDFTAAPQGIENYLPFIKTAFTPENENIARHLTNPDGQGNSAFDPEKFKQMSVQDRLVRMWGWFHGATGFSCMFLWKSGRQDAYVIVDAPNPSEAAIAAQNSLIGRFKDSIIPSQENAYVN